jgi:hypothetical protein
MPAAIAPIFPPERVNWPVKKPLKHDENGESGTRCPNLNVRLTLADSGCRGSSRPDCLLK